jgi:two-component system nitrate/nitrite sensor histidine kinase NarX
MNVYFGSHHVLNPETRTFLEGILAEIGNALQTVRLRQQELATLRQLQLARANRRDLSNALSELLENLRKNFEMDSAWLHTRAVQEGQPELDIRRGDPTWPESGGPRAIFQQTIQTGKALEGIDSLDGEASLAFNIQSVPLVLPDGMVIGAILLGSNIKPQKSSQQVALRTLQRAEVLKTVATQAALLIDSERKRELLEYTIVIQERNRLAREIHDGLAQTLAYLKLQTAQMQRALAKNDLPMLKDLLNQNYSSLADAYLDARQAIDNLRLNPQHGMNHWVDQTVKEFENLSGVPVQRCFDKLTIELPSEVQAQLVRIVQEVFSNIRKHARANHAWINVKEWGNDVILEVGDDGQGFQPDDVPGLTKYGLRGMRERAELIGADFQISSRPGEGTVVCLRLPAKLWEING